MDVVSLLKVLAVPILSFFLILILWTHNLILQRKEKKAECELFLTAGSGFKQLSDVQGVQLSAADLCSAPVSDPGPPDQSYGPAGR